MPASDASPPFGIRIVDGGMCSNESGIERRSTRMGSFLYTPGGGGGRVESRAAGLRGGVAVVDFRHNLERSQAGGVIEHLRGQYHFVRTGCFR